MRDWPDYRMILTPLSANAGGGWAAEIPELPHCIAQGSDMSQVLARIREAKDSWLDSAEASGAAPPPPRTWEQGYSGKFTLRVPRSMHRQLAEEAEAEGVSLNQYVLYLLGAARNRRYPEQKSGACGLLVHEPEPRGYK